MNFSFAKKFQPADLNIIPIFQDEQPEKLIRQKTNLVLPPAASQDFKKDLGSISIIYTAQTRLLLLALGEKKKFSPAAWRIALHTAAQKVQELNVATASLILPNWPTKSAPQYLELTGFAWVFSSYRFAWYKKENQETKLQELCLVAPRFGAALEKAFTVGVIIGTAANQARDLANHPGNVATPTHLAQHAQALAKKYKFACKAVGAAEIKKEGLGLVAGVAKGSNETPQFIVLEYGPKNQDPVALIGKGLTFDAGGISIKPADRMEEMKFDMCGGAAVLGIFEAAASLRLPIRLVGIIPATENLLSGQATKPGDVLVAHDRTSVEVINTDAEGRLVLADAISYAQTHYRPRLMIDYATLTGAVLVALGDQLTGYFANTKKYDRAFAQAAEKTAENFWPLPMPDEYKDHVKSHVADIRNVC